MQKLLALLLLITFACAILPAQEESTNESNSWSSEMWEQHKVAISLVGTVLFIVLAIAFLRYEDKARAGKMEAYAQKHGWDFVHHDNGELDKFLDTLCPGRKYHAYHIRQVQVSNPRILMFEIVFQDLNSARAKPRTATACLTELARNEPGRPQVVVYPTAHGGDDNEVDIGNEAFAEEFTVISDDSMPAIRMVSPEFQQTLLEYVKRDDAVPIRYEINPGHLFTVTTSLRDLTDEEDMDRMLAVTQKVASMINSRTK